MRAGLAFLARVAIAAEIPARTNRGVEAVWAGRAQVNARCRTGAIEAMPVLAEPVYLMLRHAKLKILGQLDGESNSALVGDTGHGRRVFELRHIVAEGKHRRVENENVAQEGFPERLD